MKKLLLLALSISLLGVFACKNENTGKSVNDTADTATVSQTVETAGEINIPKTTGVMSISDGYDKHVGNKRITADERKLLRIDDIPEKDFGTHPNSEIAKGKEIYKSANGSLKSILVIIKDHATFEYLISYNAQGEYVDCIQIGTIMDYAGDRGAAIIEGDKVMVESSWSDEEGSGQAFTQYQILPNWKFKELKN